MSPLHRARHAWSHAVQSSYTVGKFVTQKKKAWDKFLRQYQYAQALDAAFGSTVCAP